MKALGEENRHVKWDYSILLQLFPKRISTQITHFSCALMCENYPKTILLRDQFHCSVLFLG